MPEKKNSLCLEIIGCSYISFSILACSFYVGSFWLLLQLEATSSAVTRTPRRCEIFLSARSSGACLTMRASTFADRAAFPSLRCRTGRNATAVVHLVVSRDRTWMNATAPVCRAESSSAVDSCPTLFTALGSWLFRAARTLMLLSISDKQSDDSLATLIIFLGVFKWTKAEGFISQWFLCNLEEASLSE